MAVETLIKDEIITKVVGIHTVEEGITKGRGIIIETKGIVTKETET